MPSDLTPEEVAVLASVYRIVRSPSSLAIVPTLQATTSRLIPAPRFVTGTGTTALTLPPTELSRAAPEELNKWGRMLESESHNGSGNVLAWRVVDGKNESSRSM
ncbi:hypothetical protein JB92DRAFT_1304850 [Gautieria morchelliformis]|nr:hypothetical protein JB92DRAFT_1304850 [Gautieria morchelliformis]